MKLRTFYHILIATSLCLSGVSATINLSAFAEGEAPKVDEGKKLFGEAKECYDGKQYQKAAELFWQSITKGNGGPKVWLYCGHSYSASGNYTKAKKIYTDLCKAHSGTPEAKAARGYIASIANKKDNIKEDPKSPIKKLATPAPNTALGKGVKLFQTKDYQGAKAAIRKQLAKTPQDPRCYYYLALANHYQGKTSSAILNYRKVVELDPNTNLALKAKSVLHKVDPGFSASNAQAGGAKRLRRGKFETGLVTKITVIPPHKDYPHKQVRQASIETIKDALRKLPKHISDRLYAGDCKINIAPNMLDKWPKGLLDKNNEKPELYCFEEPSRTYGKDIYIYEASMHQSSRNLKKRYSQSKMRHSILYEIGNALAFIDGDFIKNEKNLEKIYLDEITKVSGNAKTVLRDYVTPKRDGLRSTCADIIAGLLGCKDRTTLLVMQNFPKTKKWLKIRLGL